MTTRAATLVAEPLSVEAFARFGRYLELRAGGSGVVSTTGDGWVDHRSLTALLDTPAHLGFTQGAAAPFEVAGMERHHHTREVLLCAADPVVFAVAPDVGAQPSASDIRAFVLNPGDVVVLNESVWHTACYGLGSPAFYYWLATADDNIADEWVQPSGALTRVEVTA